jgi:hypothetical protein
MREKRWKLHIAAHLSILTIIILSSSLAIADPGLENNPYGPEMICYKAIRAFAVTDDYRPAGYPSSHMTAIDPLNLQAPSTIGLEEVSKDGKTVLLHFFNAYGEFEAQIPFSADQPASSCINGMSFSNKGDRTLLYDSYPAFDNIPRHGTMNILQAESNCSKTLSTSAHQVGISQTEASKKLLDGEIAIMIQNVHYRWQKDFGRTPDLDRSPSGRGNPEANKAALEACRSALADSEFQSLRALITQEESKFNKVSIGSSDPQTSNHATGAGSAAGVPPH